MLWRDSTIGALVAARESSGENRCASKNAPSTGQDRGSTAREPCAAERSAPECESAKFATAALAYRTVIEAMSLIRGAIDLDACGVRKLPLLVPCGRHHASAPAAEQQSTACGL